MEDKYNNELYTHLNKWDSLEDFDAAYKRAINEWKPFPKLEYDNLTKSELRSIIYDCKVHLFNRLEKEGKSTTEDFPPLCECKTGKADDNEIWTEDELSEEEQEAVTKPSSEDVKKNE